MHAVADAHARGPSPCRDSLHSHLAGIGERSFGVLGIGRHLAVLDQARVDGGHL